MTGKLYVVGTPIGNLSDFSPPCRRVPQKLRFYSGGGHKSHPEAFKQI